MTFIANDCLLIKQTTVEKRIIQQAFDISPKLFKIAMRFLSIIGKNLSPAKHLLHRN